MRQLPKSKDPLVVRTDFSNQTAWEGICAAIREPVGGFYAYVEFLDDAAYKDMTKEQLLQIIPQEDEHGFIFLVDRDTISHAEHPLLVIDVWDEPGREFRAIPSQIQGIQNNLSIANMDFFEFAEAVDEDGVFRGFFGG
jgi:hypothetical protein